MNKIRANLCFPLKIFRGKNEKNRGKIANGAFSSELITLERNRIFPEKKLSRQKWAKLRLPHCILDLNPRLGFTMLARLKFPYAFYALY